MWIVIPVKSYITGCLPALFADWHISFWIFPMNASASLNGAKNTWLLLGSEAMISSCVWLTLLPMPRQNTSIPRLLSSMAGRLTSSDENPSVTRSSTLCFDVGGWLNNCFWATVRAFPIRISRFGILALSIARSMLFWSRNLSKCTTEGCGEPPYTTIPTLLPWGDTGNKWETCFTKSIILAACWVPRPSEEEELSKTTPRWTLPHSKGKNISNDITLI